MNAPITCADTRLDLPGTIRTRLYRESNLISDFCETGVSCQKGAELEIIDGPGRITSPDRFASIRKTITVDFARDPVIEVNVPKAKGLWAMKANDGSREVDWGIQTDCAITGKRTYELSEFLPWESNKEFELILFAIGADRPVYFDDIRLQYTH